MKGLYLRLTIAFVSIASGVLLISTLTFIWQTHYHFSLYQQQAMEQNMDTAAFDSHFEEALIQSVVWTSAIVIVLVAAVSLLVAKRITAPLINMKKTAEQMAQGKLHVRAELRGKDELADLGQSLNRLAEQLQRQEQLRKAMTADIAHELRTPLTTLKSHMAAMMDGIWEPSPKRLESCYEEVERLADLVGDLEQLTEMESPHFQVRMNRENLTEIVLQSVESVKAAYLQKGVQLKVKGANPYLVQADRKRVMQILLNLLSNALKFTKSGGEVVIVVSREPMHAVFTVADSGIGIRPQELPFVFERFYRVDKSRDRKSGGSGIGLTIVQKLTEAHGGSVHIRSEEGKGTAVTIKFPAV